MNRATIATALSVVLAAGAVASCSLFITFDDTRIPPDDAGSDDAGADGTAVDSAPSDGSDSSSGDGTDGGTDTFVTDATTDTTPSDGLGVDTGSDTIVPDTTIVTDTAGGDLGVDVTVDLGTETTADDALDANETD